MSENPWAQCTHFSLYRKLQNFRPQCPLLSRLFIAQNVVNLARRHQKLSLAIIMWTTLRYYRKSSITTSAMPHAYFFLKLYEFDVAKVEFQDFFLDYRRILWNWLVWWVAGNLL